MDFEFSKTGGAQSGSATGSDTEIELRLSSDNFDVKQFVRDVGSKYDTQREWFKHKKRIQALAERTAMQLKQNVVKNYVLFIDTSKEISSLEAEMYQLSQYLHEQHDLTQSLQTLSITESRTAMQEMESAEKQDKHSISTLLETVESGSIVTEVAERYIVHSGTLYELDRESYKELNIIRAFLLNDSLMTATFVHKRRGPVKYRFQNLYELENMAIVDVKDTDILQCAFKILMFPDSHLYQAESEEDKKQWIQLLDGTKRRHKDEVDAAKREVINRVRSDRIASMSMDRTSSISVHRSSASSDQATSGLFTKVNVKEPSAAAATPAGMDRRQSDFPVDRRQSEFLVERRQSEFLMEDWIKEVPENLDVYIAQREFDQAVELIMKTKAFIKGDGDSHILRDLRARLNHRINRLSDVLKKELEASPSGSLRGGPRAARRAVGLLIKLGRSAEACTLFLENYRQIILHDIEDVKMEGSINLYVSNFAATFFTGLRNAATEFERAFEKNYGSYSTFITWCNSLLKLFSEKCAKVIFRPEGNSGYSLSTVTDCILSTMKPCDVLNDIGLDLSFALWSYYHPYMAEALDNGRKYIREECATSGTAETWEPLDLKKDQPKLSAVILQMQSLGMTEFSNLVHEGIVDLSGTTINFCIMAIDFMNDVFRIYTPQLLEDFIGCFCDIFHNMVELYSDALGRDENISLSECITGDAQFVIETLLPTFITKMNMETGVDIPDLIELHDILQDAFEKRSRGASVEPPVTRPAEPYDPNNESPSDEEEEDDDDIA